MTTVKIESKQVDEYLTFLNEFSRPPSKGGNTGAEHVHVLIIEGERYSFFALGAKKWAYKNDKVSFEYLVNGNYMNIDKASFTAADKDGLKVVRGDRGSKPQRRTVSARMPGSRREQRD